MQMVFPTLGHHDLRAKTIVLMAQAVRPTHPARRILR